jgi:hypothetical protein
MALGLAEAHGHLRIGDVVDLARKSNASMMRKDAA